MTVDELRLALADLPGDAEIQVWAEARCTSSDELFVVGVGVDGDGILRAFLDMEDDQPIRIGRRGYFT